MQIKKVSVFDQEINTTVTSCRPAHELEEEPQNTNSNKTSGREIKHSNQLPLPRQYDCKIKKDTK